MNYSSNGQQPPSQKPQEATKICKYCGKEIPEQAKVCPYCRKKQSHTVRNVILIIVGVVVLLALLFSCIGGGGDDTSSDSGASSNSSSNNNAVATDTAPEGQNNAPAQTEYTVGSTFTANDISATLNSVTVSMGDQYNQPQAGYVYLISSWTVANNGSEDFNPFEFSVSYYVDGATVDGAITGLPDQFDRGTTIIPGTSTTGNLIIEVPETWAELQERVQIGTINGETAIFKVSPSQTS